VLQILSILIAALGRVLALLSLGMKEIPRKASLGHNRSSSLNEAVVQSARISPE
jgi:hypothetical protein